MQQTFATYPADTIKRAWVDKPLILGEILKHKGGNYFNVPHIGAAAQAAPLSFS